jgi:hypothetical protein
MSEKYLKEFRLNSVDQAIYNVKELFDFDAVLYDANRLLKDCEDENDVDLEQKYKRKYAGAIFQNLKNVFDTLEKLKEDEVYVAHLSEACEYFGNDPSIDDIIDQLAQEKKTEKPKDKKTKRKLSGIKPVAPPVEKPKPKRGKKTLKPKDEQQAFEEEMANLSDNASKMEIN